MIQRVASISYGFPQAAQAQYESLIINACGILLRNPQNGRELKVLKWKLGKRFKKINTRRISNKKMLNFINLVIVCFLCVFFPDLMRF